jgi:DNA-3-methyladenine glycosylase I
MAGGDLVRGAGGRPRCFWGGERDDDAMARYHDEEWGRPVVDDRELFEKICLDGFQSGLSWRTILLRREAFRRAFASFDPARVARFSARKVEALLLDASIIRHRGKIEATVQNARALRPLVEEFGSLAAYIWRFEPEAGAAPTRASIPATSPASIALSKDLRRRGFGFVGPTTAYAFMQAVGLVNDHVAGCFARAEVERARARLARPGR